MGNGYDFAEPGQEARTDPAIQLPPVAWSDELDEPEHHEPPAPTPADERIKLGLAGGSFVAMAAALAAGHTLAAAAFGGLVNTIMAHYFSRKGQP